MTGHGDARHARSPGSGLVYAGAISLVAFAIFWFLGDVATDNAEHTQTAVKIRAGDAEWPPNFLYYGLVIVLGGLFGDAERLVFTSCVLLAVAVGAKAWLTERLFCQLAPDTTFRLRALATTALLFAFPIPVAFLVGATLSYFLGNIPPNVWHNSTTIFLMPFALLAFALQARDFETRTTRHVPAIIVLIVVGVVVKPSFFFAYAPATALWLALSRRPMGEMLVSALPILAGGVVTAVLYVLIYQLQQGSLHDEASGIGIAPFAVWSRILAASEIPLAVIASFLAPIIYFVLGLRPRRMVWTGYAALLTAIAVLFYVLVVETGPRATHGNFFWQTVVCSYILHLVLAGDLLDRWARGHDRTRVLVAASIFLAMSLSGVVYLYRLIFLDVFLPY